MQSPEFRVSLKATADDRPSAEMPFSDVLSIASEGKHVRHHAQHLRRSRNQAFA